MPEEIKPSSTPNPPAAAPSAQPSSARPSFPPKRRPYGPRRKVCRLCAEQIERIDYKQFQILRTFTSENGKMLSSRITGTCAKHQRQITKAIKRNRNVAILPYVSF